jgi:photosystem II stability/assembly factor-like uncharacterized protein
MKDASVIWTNRLPFRTLPRVARSLLLVVFLLAALGSARGQWEIQESHSPANLRGIHSVDGLVAWASGADGTVLRTQDGGSHWQRCALLPGAEKLDFRGIWAWDAHTAIVMSSGPGDLSRLYRTTDGCSHWTEEARSSDPEGFWDAVAFQAQDFGRLGNQKTGVLIGDPVRGRFYTQVMILGHGWSIDDAACVSRANEAAFAASNSSVFVFGSRRYIIGTGGKGGPRALLSPLLAGRNTTKGCLEASLPLASGSDSSGAFSLAFRDLKHGLAVGGDYKKPGEPSGTAAWTQDGGKHWTAASQPPRGYRSAVAWYPAAKAWIAAGTNGSDISHDDGKTWQVFDNGDWNALSLPYVVGPKGRIGRLRSGALKP